MYLKQNFRDFDLYKSFDEQAKGLFFIQLMKLLKVIFGKKFEFVIQKY